MKNPLLPVRKCLRFFGAAFLCLFLISGVRLFASTDYAPAIWRSAYSGHWYTTGYGHRFIVEHDMEGYYASCISYFQKSTTMVSATFLVNGKKDTSTDYAAGEITQMVRLAYYAWHARCWNQYSHGTEHEGFVSNPAWFTEALYTASASATKFMCDKYAVAKDRNHVIGHDQKRISSWQTWMSSQGYSSSFITCNDHTDPGAYWDWSHYMDLVKGTVSIPSAPSSLTATAASSSQINLAWADNSAIETGFKIERATSSAGTYTQVATVGTSVKTYSNTGLSPATTYYYRVRAYNASGNSAYSNIANATTKDVPPAAPTALTASGISSSQIGLAWAQNSANETGFKIERGTDGTNFTQVATVGVNVVTFTDSGLLPNTLYYYRVRAYNTAGDSAYSNTASDLTGPAAPTALTATAVSQSQIDLAWTDNSANENGFKVERATASAGPYTTIATNDIGATTFSSTGLTANTTYYFRVASCNANGNSSYSNTGTATTLPNPPVLTAIGNKTVGSGTALTFTASASNPNQLVTTNTWQTFQSFPGNTPNETILFRKPSSSATTSVFIDTSVTNYTYVVTNGPSVWGSGNKCLKAGWNFKTGFNEVWLRLHTLNTATNPNPTIALDQKLQFKVYSAHTLRVSLGVRETGTTAAYGANGGTNGAIEWVGATSVTNGVPLGGHSAPIGTNVEMSFNIPFESQLAFSGGDGVVDQSGAKGVLEHVAIQGTSAGAGGVNYMYFDDFAVVTINTLAYTLDAGAPPGASIGYRTGVFNWVPSNGQEGNWLVTVRVTDRLGAVDYETFTVTVTGGAGNRPPVLSAIGNKTVNELSALAFTAAATDPDSGQTLSYSLDPGAPAGASINSASAAFTWTPTEAQGPGSYPITVRVTDNGTPSSNDWETITVVVNEVNTAPVLAPITNQTVNEGGTVSVTASASDADVPAQTITYSLDPGAPAGMTINASSGAIAWTTTEANGPGTYTVTVRAKDNGTPLLNSARTFTVTVNEVNTAPVVTANTTVSSAINFADFEGFSDGTYNGTVMFRQPSYSGSTSSFLNTTSNNTTSVEATFPAGNISSRAMWANFNFKTGTTNPWLRLLTYNASTLANPTISLDNRLRFDIYCDKSMKVAIAARETGTGAAYGADGTTTGPIEFVGVSGLNGTTPIPTRTVAAGTWTTLEFNMPAEGCASFWTGNGVLASGKGVLEHIALVPNGGMGAYNVYLDNFSVVTVTSNFVVDPGETVTFTNTVADSDLPAQNITFSLDSGAPVGATIDPVTGVFTWTPDGTQWGTNVVTIRATDDGPGNLSGTKSVSIIVNKVNTAPRLGAFPQQAIEATSGQTITLTATAEDDDVPADTLTFSLQGTVPAGAAIDPVTGVFTWTPGGGLSTNVFTVRVTDNGVPPLYAESDFTVIVAPSNAPPVLSLSPITVTEKVIDFESITDFANEHVLFNKPSNSGTTSAHIDATQANTSYVTNNGIPAGNPGGGTKSMKVQWTFKTGTSNPWLRLNTWLVGSPSYINSPTIELKQKWQFSIYTTKSLKICVAAKETGTTAAIGANGQLSGALLEWVGCTNYTTGSAPSATRIVSANTWTTLTFDFPNEPVRGFTGDGVLANGRGVFDGLALIPNGSLGAYTVYVDNFKQIYTYATTNTVVANTGATIGFTATGTDTDIPAQTLSYGLDADFADSHTNAVMNETNGVFTWTPGTTDAGTTNSITVFVEDNPANGGVVKSDSKTINVVVNADPLGVQSAGIDATMVSAGERATLEWSAVVGHNYRIQMRTSESDWSDVTTVAADSENESVHVSAGDNDAYFRIIDLSDNAVDQ